MNVSLIAKTDTGNMSVVDFLASVARRCYSIKSWQHLKETVEDGKVNAKSLVKSLINNKHMSVLEHVSYTFSIEGLSTAALGQLARHRVASFTVTSLRYNNLSKADSIDYVMPDVITPGKAEKIFTDSINASLDAYNALIAEGFKPQQARYVLPQGVATNLILTMNVRELFHFFELRNNNHADDEIHELAETMLKILDNESKYLFSFANHNEPKE